MEGNEQKKVVIELQNVKRNFIVGDEVVQDVYKRQHHVESVQTI